MTLGKTLHTADYAVFGLGIFVSLATGIVFAYRERKHATSFHFHRGGGKLLAFPVAMSMLVTFESSIFYLGYPAEVYVHGFVYWLVNIGMALGFSAMFWISIPLFYPLQVTSVFEYLQLRHDSLLIRQAAMALSMLHMLLYAGIVLFGAAVALQSVTGLDVWIYIVAMSAIAVIYTSLGGIKAVVVTDVVQGVIMIAMIFIMLIYGTMRAGGFQNVIYLNRSSGRLNLIDFDPNPLTRHTFWTLIVGGGARALAFSCRPAVIQRLNSTKSINEARKVAAISIPGFVILQIFVMFEGIVAYAYFANKGCDPLASKQISNPNQIIAFAIMDMFENVPGVTGLFLAALCSASLSTISSLLSSLSAVVSEDVVRKKWVNISEAKLTRAAKLIVLVCGAVCIGVALLITTLKGPTSQISGSILGSIDGPLTALFMMSIFVKFTTRKALLISITIGIVFALWLSLGYNFSPGRKKTHWLPLGPTYKCNNNSDSDFFINYTAPNQTLTTPLGDMSKLVSHVDVTTVATAATEGDEELRGLDYLYSISYQYFALMVMIVTLAIGIPLSKLTELERHSAIPSYLMLSLNKRFFRCQPNYMEVPEASVIEVKQGVVEEPDIEVETFHDNRVQYEVSEAPVLEDLLKNGK